MKKGKIVSTEKKNIQSLINQKPRGHLTYFLIKKFSEQLTHALSDTSLNDEDRIHIIEVFIELDEMASQQLPWDKIYKKYYSELRKKLREKFALGHRLKLLEYFDDHCSLTKAMGNSDNFFYTTDEINAMGSLEFQILNQKEFSHLLRLISNHLHSELGLLLDKPVSSMNVKGEQMGNAKGKSPNTILRHSNYKNRYLELSKNPKSRHAAVVKKICLEFAISEKTLMRAIK
ncbi:MAG: hypothetical protein IPP32_05310 [Bacteroidetes bacterium]|nr:hypothetical protein [Bacteroidota bacterium]